MKTTHIRKTPILCWPLTFAPQVDAGDARCGPGYAVHTVVYTHGELISVARYAHWVFFSMANELVSCMLHFTGNVRIAQNLLDEGGST